MSPIVTVVTSRASIKFINAFFRKCYGMDELAQKWKKLSLTDVEGRRIDLSKKKKIGSHVVAAKFLTRQNINIKAVACTFRPIWRTRGNFKVNDAGGNVILFDFELEVDAVKVMMGEPWAFDRHLVVVTTRILVFCNQCFSDDQKIVTIRHTLVTIIYGHR